MYKGENGGRKSDKKEEGNVHIYNVKPERKSNPPKTLYTQGKGHEGPSDGVDDGKGLVRCDMNDVGTTSRFERNRVSWPLL